jgi:hypothetical protein
LPDARGGRPPLAELGLRDQLALLRQLVLDQREVREETLGLVDLIGRHDRRDAAPDRLHQDRLALDEREHLVGALEHAGRVLGAVGRSRRQVGRDGVGIEVDDGPVVERLQDRAAHGLDRDRVVSGDLAAADGLERRQRRLTLGPIQDLDQRDDVLGIELLDRRDHGAVAVLGEERLLGLEQALAAGGVTDLLVLEPLLAELLGDDRLGDLRPLDRVLGPEDLVEAQRVAQAQLEEFERAFGAADLEREVERRVAQEEVVLLALEPRLEFGVADLELGEVFGARAIAAAALELPVDHDRELERVEVAAADRGAQEALDLVVGDPPAVDDHRGAEDRGLDGRGGQGGRGGRGALGRCRRGAGGRGQRGKGEETER